MLIEAHPVSPWQANCYLVAAEVDDPQSPRQCLVIDPGIMSFDIITNALAQRGWQPAAVVLTHGHLDHAGDAHAVAARWDVPVFCAGADQPMLERPSLGLGESFISIIEQFLGADALPLPAEVRGLAEPFQVAGLRVRPFAAPGHTAGSTLLEVSDDTTVVVFTGDVLFAGTIGRTDLPSGNMAEMRETLRRIRDSFPEDVPLLPGHGPGTTLELEMERNPFMHDEN
ncbi:MAG: MBL fold metallo-hydrolase [Propionibacteriaceae bacterium]|nr:MBL fold metallo-hydrolase [Propionibacteriaceae bacterium]